MKTVPIGGPMATFQNRVVGALRIHPPTFEEVEQDTSATTQAALIVAAAAISGGIADLRGLGVGAIGLRLVAGLLGWAIASYVVLFVGTRLLPGKKTQADLGQLLRTTGFAQAIGLFGVIGIVPGLGWLTRAVVGIWMLVTMVVAVRQALDYDDTWSAVVTCLAAWAIIIAATFVASFFGFGAATLTSGAF
jgi:hypothetical protein